jgi:hypothetical protein
MTSRAGPWSPTLQSFTRLRVGALGPRQPRRAVWGKLQWTHRRRRQSRANPSLGNGLKIPCQEGKNKTLGSRSNSPENGTPSGGGGPHYVILFPPMTRTRARQPGGAPVQPLEGCGRVTYRSNRSNAPQNLFNFQPLRRREQCALCASARPDRALRRAPRMGCRSESRGRCTCSHRDRQRLVRGGIGTYQPHRGIAPLASIRVLAKNFKSDARACWLSIARVPAGGAVPRIVAEVKLPISA